MGERRKKRGTKPKAARNAEIYRRWQGGGDPAAAESLGALARAFGVTHQRIQQIIRREAARRRETPRKGRRAGLHIPRGKIPLDPAVVRAYLNREVNATQGAALCGVSPTTFTIRVRETTGRSKQKERDERGRARAARMYESFIGGKTLREIAEEEHTTPGVIGQLVFRHRTRTGAPGKREALAAAP